MADQVIEDIKNKLDVVDVLSGYIQVKRSGTNFKAVCPFHNEKSASLMVSPTKQIWHCFGCNEGGDIFGFVMRMENLEFREALKLLADRAGVQLPERPGYSKQIEDVKEKLFRINTFAAAFYHKQLETSKARTAYEYLQKRGLKAETIARWQIGYAPNDFHSLEVALLKKGVAREDLVRAGVSVRGDKGNMYDRFRNRVTFPIYNYTGQVVGFTARTLDSEDAGAKYINSPETDIYSKSSILFGLNFAKGDIRKNDNAIVVEGQMDCITAHEAGYTNVVATSGTALTEHQLRQLARLTKNIKFCFDADLAGQAASRRAGDLALSLGFAVKVVTIPAGKDPDELIRKDGPSWKKALADAAWFIDFYLERGLQQFSDNSLEQKKYLSAEIIPLLKRLVDPLERDHYITKIARTYTVQENTLRKQFGENHTSIAAAEVSSHKLGANSNFAVGLEKEILGGMLLYDEFVPEVKSILHPTDFVDPEVQDIIVRMFNGEKAFQVIDSPLAKEAQFMVESELENLDGNTVAIQILLRKNAYMLRLTRIKSEQESLASHIRQAELTKDQTRLQQLNVQFAELLKLRLTFENKINEN